MSEWPALIDELDAWGAAGSTATFWWRDDDAVEPTEQLDRLLPVAQSVPLALAVIPGLATAALAERLEDCHRITVLQHGWRHSNHSPSGDSEYPCERPTADVRNELCDGRERLSAMFGERFEPVFAPPWHRFDDAFLPLLAESGIGSISRRGPRKGGARSAGIFESNVHALLIDWTRPPTFVGDAIALQRILKHLRGRRQRTCDADEATGILTHHLVEDPRSYDFIERLADVVADHRAAEWLPASEIFARQVR
jgi:hypothetical protein